MVKIALGTTSEAKRKYLEEVLEELSIIAEIESLEIKSEVSDQPITTNETKKGSINRAEDALKASANSDFGMGIEVGYHPDKNGDYEMFCWTTIIDKNKKVISAQSHKLKLPKFHQQILKENKYLGDHVRVYLEQFSDPLSQHVGEIIRHRKPFIQTATKSALLQFLIS